MLEIARLYRDAQSSFLEVFNSLDTDQQATPVMCSPEWTVRDVLSHLAGVTDDIANGRVDGAATDPWTAAQIERWRDTDTATLIEQWNSQIGPVSELLEQFGESRPIFDVHTHEQDIRNTFGLRGNRDSELALLIAERFQVGSVGRPVTISFLDGTSGAMPGEGDPIGLSGISQYEFVRSRLGRRSPDQVRAYDWSETPDDELLTAWFAFGPSAIPIVELA